MNIYDYLESDCKESVLEVIQDMDMDEMMDFFADTDPVDFL